MRNLLFIIALVGCGVEQKQSTEITSAIPENAVEISVGKKSLLLEKGARLSIDCNQFYFEFAIAENGNGCKAVTVETGYSDEWNWHIQSSDNKIDVKALKVEGEQLQIGDTTYFCYMYDGSSFSRETGEENIWAASIFLVDGFLDKSDDLAEADIFMVGTERRACDDIY